MRASVAARWAVLAAACLVLLGSAEPADEGQAATAEERFLRAYYDPPHDPTAGRLYPSVLDLLDAVEELRKIGPARAPAPEGGLEGEATATADAASFLVTPRGGTPEGWVAIVESFVAAQDKVAHAYFRGKSYDEAARMYRKLLEHKPENAHLRFMLGLCERNLGRLAESRDLLEGAVQKDKSIKEWADWLEEVTKLTDGMKGKAE